MQVTADLINCVQTQSSNGRQVTAVQNLEKIFGVERGSIVFEKLQTHKTSDNYSSILACEIYHSYERKCITTEFIKISSRRRCTLCIS